MEIVQFDYLLVCYKCMYVYLKKTKGKSENENKSTHVGQRLNLQVYSDPDIE